VVFIATFSAWCFIRLIKTLVGIVSAKENPGSSEWGNRLD